jgi:hypothetical protein
MERGRSSNTSASGLEDRDLDGVSVPGRIVVHANYGWIQIRKTSCLPKTPA